MGVNHFGPGVVGAAQYEEQVRLDTSGELVWGPGVLLHNPTPAAAGKSEPLPGSEEADLLADDPKTVTIPEHNAMSIADLQAQLAADPALFDRLFHGEFGRPEGARKGALGVLLSFEQTHANRPEVTEALTDMLKKKES